MLLTLRVTGYLSLIEYQDDPPHPQPKVAKIGTFGRPSGEASNKPYSPRGIEKDLASLINGEVTSCCDNEASSLDIISESFNNSVKYWDQCQKN